MNHIKIANWKPALYGWVVVAAYVFAYFFPEHKDFINGFIPLLLGIGFITHVKDRNVTGGAKDNNITKAK